VTEELEVLTIVAGRLEAAGIAYMVTGSFAANYYAVPRMTRDIDLVVELSVGDADRFCALFEGDFYLDRDVVRAAIIDRGAFKWSRWTASSARRASTVGWSSRASDEA
jgi:hypothetical protein